MNDHQDPSTLLFQVRRDLLNTGTALPLLRAVLANDKTEYATRVAACRHLQDLGYWDQSILNIEASLDRYPGSVALHLLAANHDPVYLGLAESLARDSGKDLAPVAQALRAKGAVQQALDLLSSAKSTPPQLADLGAMAECFVELKDLERLQSVLSDMQVHHPSARHTHKLALRMAWLTGGTDAVLHWVSEEEAAARAIPQAVFHRLLAGRALSEAAAWAETTGGPQEAWAAIALLSARPEEAETFLVRVLEQQEPEARTLSLWELSVKTALALGPSGAERAATRLGQAKRLFPNKLSLDQLAAEAALQDGDWTRATASLHGRPGPGQSRARGRAQADLAHRIGGFSPGASGAQAVRHALDRGDLEAAAAQLQALSRLWWDERVQALRLQAELAVLRGDLPTAQATCDALEKLDPIRPATAHLCTRVALLSGDWEGAAAHRAQFRTRRAVDVSGVRLEVRRDVPDLMLTPPVNEQGARTAQAVARLSQLGPGQEPDQMPKAPIPAQILSYWEGPRSALIERISQAWRDHHPHLAWRSFDGDQAAAWIADHASEQVQTAFQQALGPAQRADIFRLAVLAQDGGLYVDLDDLPRASVSPLLSDADLVLVQEPGHGAIANNFMAGCPGHSFFTAALEEIVTAPPAHGVETWTVSGPGLMARVLAESLETNPEAFSSFRRVPWARYAAHVAPNLTLPHKLSDTYWRRTES